MRAEAQQERPALRQKRITNNEAIVCRSGTAFRSETEVTQSLFLSAQTESAARLLMRRHIAA